jgi:hypothetical protein
MAAAASPDSAAGPSRLGKSSRGFESNHIGNVAARFDLIVLDRPRSGEGAASDQPRL